MESFASRYPDLLTEPDQIPVLGIRILAYYDEQNVLKYKVMHDVALENIPVSQVIGILEMAKLDLVAAAAEKAGNDGKEIYD
jgi:hypothetical protein